MMKKLSEEEVEKMVQLLMDETQLMKGGGVLTPYGFLISDYIRARERMSTLQEVLTERYEEEEKMIH